MVILTAHGPGLVLSFAGIPRVGGVDVRAFLAVGLDPFEGPLELGVVVDPLVEAADDLAHVDGLVAHAEVVLEEVRVDDRAADAHRDRADGKVGLAPHPGGGEARPGEAEDLLGDVGGDGLGVLQVLDVAAVDAEGGQALLVVGREDSREIDGAGPVGAVEAPDGLTVERVHVHGLGAVAPAGSHGQGDGRLPRGRTSRAGGRLGDAADAAVSDDAFDRGAGGVADASGDELGRGLGHGHRRRLERLAHALPPSMVGLMPILGSEPTRPFA